MTNKEKKTMELWDIYVKIKKEPTHNETQRLEHAAG